MKVVHVLKRIEAIDSDIKELRKMEKSLQRNKSFTTPIYLSIEKQINILLGDRIKMLELKIENPPANMLEQIEEKKAIEAPLPSKTPVRQKRQKPQKAQRRKKPKGSKEAAGESAEGFDDEAIPMLTQDLIDEKITRMQAEPPDQAKGDKKETRGSDSVKLLDIALEKGTLPGEKTEKEKKKIKFFRDNFPGGDY
jgi:hypothetical protein